MLSHQTRKIKLMSSGLIPTQIGLRETPAILGEEDSRALPGIFISINVDGVIVDKFYIKHRMPENRQSMCVFLQLTKTC